MYWAAAKRLCCILAVLVRHAGALLASRCAARWPRVRAFRRSGALPPPERLRLLFEQLGGSMIKFGQMLALQPDILPLEYCNALFNLLDRVSPFPFAAVERTFFEELGRRPDELFDRFEHEPLATASIGQVHVGWRGGRKFAVKVQRPTVIEDFAGDIRLMSAAIRLIRLLRLRPLYWAIEPMSEFVVWTGEELDYRVEARYARILRQNARTNPHEYVPEVLEELTTRRILVIEFLEGATILSCLRALGRGDAEFFEALDAGGFDSHRVAANVIDNFLGDVFRHGIFHADLHPANLVALPGNVVGYLDFGITGAISAYSRQNLIALTLAYTRGDVQGMCDAFFKVSSVDHHSKPRLFRETLQRLAGGWYEEGRHGNHLRKNFTLVMLDMLRLSRATGIWPERDVIKYIRSAIAIDGLITRFAPSFDLGGYLEQVCRSYLRWHMREALLDCDSMLEWFTASFDMSREGPLRAAKLARQVCAGSIPGRVHLLPPEEGASGLRRRATCLGAFALGICVLLGAGEGGAPLGMNVFTAELVSLAACSVMLLRTVAILLKDG